MGQLQFTVSLIMAGLFAIALIGFAVNFATDNDAPITILDDAQILNLKTQTIGNTTSFGSSSSQTLTTIINSTIEAGDETTTSGASFKLTPVNSIGVIINIVRIGYKKIFGNDDNFEIFLLTFIGIITFTMAMLIAKAWFGRNTE